MDKLSPNLIPHEVFKSLQDGHIICKAIRSHQRLEFTYDGEVRLVDPYIYGVSSAGNIVLSAFQVKKGWRMFQISGVQKLQIVSSTFPPHKDYNPNDPNFIEVLCQVD